jgi:hypothetical protein
VAVNRNCTLPSGENADGATYSYNLTQVPLQPGQTIYRVAIIRVTCADGYDLEVPTNVSVEYQRYGVCSKQRDLPGLFWNLDPPRCLPVEGNNEGNARFIFGDREAIDSNKDYGWHC